METYSDKCRLKGYENHVDWYLAWETYKYLYRHENLLKEKRYRALCEAVEYIIVCHRMVKNSQSRFADILDFYRFYVTLAKDEDRYNLVLTNDVEEYLLLIAKNKAERISDKLFSLYANRKILQ